MFDINACSTTVIPVLQFLLLIYILLLILDIFGGNMSMDHHEDSRESVSFDDHLTPAERRFLHQTQKLELQRLAKMANKSHRDRIHEFNQYLANLTEHYDIPKVGPG